MKIRVGTAPRTVSNSSSKDTDSNALGLNCQEGLLSVNGTGVRIFLSNPADIWSLRPLSIQMDHSSSTLVRTGNHFPPDESAVGYHTSGRILCVFQLLLDDQFEPPEQATSFLAIDVLLKTYQAILGCMVFKDMLTYAAFFDTGKLNVFSLQDTNSLWWSLSTFV